MDEPSKGLRIQGRVVEKQGISDGFWSTSTYDLDNSALQSQRSYSSISISNQTLSQISGPAGISSHPEFINHGKTYQCISSLLLLHYPLDLEAAQRARNLLAPSRSYVENLRYMTNLVCTYQLWFCSVEVQWI